MNDPSTKLQIYKGIIQYILDSTHYTLKNIADLSGTSLDAIKSIYCHGVAPCSLKSEMALIKLYRIILELHMNPNNRDSSAV